MAVIPADKCERCGSSRVRRYRRKHIHCDDCKHVGGVVKVGITRKELNLDAGDITELQKLAKKFEVE